MEIITLMHCPPGEERPRDAEPRFFGADDTFTAADDLRPGLSRVFDQDFGNLPRVHKGLKSLRSGSIQLGDYQEVRIRHFNQTLDKFLA